MIYLITGAAGHLGSTVVAQLLLMGRRVRCMIQPSQAQSPTLPRGVEIVVGDVLEPETLEAAFRHGPDEELCVIHNAGIVTIATKYQKFVYDVNVNGTKNVLAQCQEHGVSKLVYVSSVHAIAEAPRGEVITETKEFDPDKVKGFYAKTKAEATDAVLAAGQDGLRVCVVHPSGLCGPNDRGRGHVTQLLIDYCKRLLTSGISKGGYDFVDVRDVAAGIIACCDKGRPGESYILSNRYYSVRELLGLFHEVTGRPPVRSFLPMWFARWTAPIAELYYKILKQPPLYTPYSLYTLTSNAMFSHAKADAELGYSCRPMEATVWDAYVWLQFLGRLKKDARTAVKSSKTGIAQKIL